MNSFFIIPWLTFDGDRTEVYDILGHVVRPNCVDMCSGMCGYSQPQELQQEVGGTFTPEISNPQAEGVVAMLTQIQPHTIVSLESGGVFMRCAGTILCTGGYTGDI